MSIIYASIVPHAPILLPAVGKEHLSQLQQTLAALERIHAQLQTLAPDTIIVVAPQDNEKPKKQFYLHVAQQYTAEFSQFGDLVTNLTIESDPMLADRIKNAMNDGGFPTMYTTDPALDYSVSVPLVTLLKKVNSKLIVINPAESSSLRKQFEYGRALQRILQATDKRIAVIAAGDISHDNPKNPNSSSPAAVFEKDFIALLKREDVKKILSLNLAAIQEAGACGLPAIALLLGILESMHSQQNIFSFESPLSVGHLVAEYTF